MVRKSAGQKREGQSSHGLRGPLEFEGRQATRSLRIEGGPLERWFYKRRKGSIDGQIRATIGLLHGSDIWSDWLETGSMTFWVPELTTLSPEEVWVKISTRRLFVGVKKPPTDSQVVLRYAVEPSGNHYRVKLDFGEHYRDLLEMVRRKLEPGWGP